MESQHHSELTLNLLMLVTKIAAQGDFGTMQKLGIRYDQLDKLQALSTQEIQQMALITKAKFVSIQFDAEALDMAINIGNQRVGERNSIIALLKAGATRPMMQQLFGLTRTETVNLRKFLGLSNVDGRPSAPTEQQETALWHVWQQIRHQEREMCQQLLTMHEKSGIKANIIWPLLQDWSIRHPKKRLSA